jgi:molybdopterin synthase catalytic subunit
VCILSSPLVGEDSSEGFTPILSFSLLKREGTIVVIKVTDKPLSPEAVVNLVRSPASGCVVTYVGLIRETSHDKKVVSVEYSDPDGGAEIRLRGIADEARRRYPVNGVAIHHRVGKLKMGDINLVVTVAAGHRVEGFAACQYIIDRFKEELPTRKRETYADGSFLEGD